MGMVSVEGRITGLRVASLTEAAAAGGGGGAYGVGGGAK